MLVRAHNTTQTRWYYVVVRFFGGVGGWNVFRNFEGPHPLEIPVPKGSDVQETSVSLSDIYMILLRACLEQKNSQVESIAPQPLTAQKALEQSR